MDALTLSGAGLASALGAANTMAAALGGTFSSNAGWLILVAAAGLICGVVAGIFFVIGRLGRSDGVSINALSSPASNGVTDAMYGSLYLKYGGDINKSFNQEFIRAWGRDYETARRNGMTEDQAARWAHI